MSAVMSKISQGLAFLGRSVGVLVFLAFFSLALMVRTTMMTGYSEWAEMSSVPWYVYVSALVLLGLPLYSPKLFKGYDTGKIFKLLSIAYLVAGLGLILLTAYNGRDDAGRVFNAALQFNLGKFTYLDPDQYLYRYPHQLGLVTFERLVLYLIPIPVISLFFLLNLGMVIGMHYTTWKITDALFARSDISRFVVLMSFGFLPLFFNIMFAYGLMYGLFFANLAVLFFIRFLKNKGLKEAVHMVFFITLSYWVRNNNIILIIALAGMLLLYFLKQKDYRFLLVILPLFAFPIAAQKTTVAYYETVIQKEIPGTPQIAWLAMGVQEDESSNRLPGWYTGYVRTIYEKKEGDIKKIEEDADNLFTNRMLYFIQNPDEAMWFFGIKYVSSWTEGSFQSIWSGPSKASKQFLWNPLAKSIYHDGKLHLLLITYMQGSLILLYLGGLIYYVFTYKNLGDGATMGLYAFLYLFGGIIFHLISETKSQYTLPYLYLHFPMIAAGLNDMVLRSKRLYHKWIANKAPKTTE